MLFSRNYFPLVMSSAGGLGISKHYHKMQYSMAIAALSIFGAKTKIVLTGVRSRDRESLAKRLI